jgi:TonB family protein
VDAFARQDQAAFKRVALIEYPRRGMWSLAFVTGRVGGEIAARLGRDDLVSVFLPTTPNPTSGFLLLVPREEVAHLDMPVEDKKAQALAELLSDTTERQQALADTHGDQVAGNFDDLIRLRAAEGWTRPPSARNNMTVQLQVNMLPDGTITNVSVSRSSGDVPFDNSAVAAVKNIGRLTEMQGLSPQDFQPYRSFKMTFTPEDLAL